MSSIEALEEWSALPNSFRLVRVNWDGPETWRAELLTTNSTAVPDLVLSARKAAVDDRVIVSLSMPTPASVVALSAESPERALKVRDAISAVDRARPGLLTCSTSDEGGNATIEIASVIYGDGFSRHALNSAVHEILKAYLTVDQSLDDLTIAALLSGAAAISGEGTQPVDSLVSASGSTTRSECSACGRVNPVHSRFCNQCGTSLVDNVDE